MSRWPIWMTPPLALVALLMVALTVAPARIWHQPATDAVYDSFDPNLMYSAAPAGSHVSVASGAVDMTAAAHSGASVNLLTTPLQRLSGRIDITVLDGGGGAAPLTVGFWSPAAAAGYLVTFGPAPADTISSAIVTNGTTGATLIGGNAIGATVLGTYVVGQTYRLVFDLDKTAGKISYSVIGAGSEGQPTDVTKQDAPALLDSTRVAFTASSTAAIAPNHVVLSDWSLTLPHQAFWADKVADPTATWALLVLAGAGLVLLALALWFRRKAPMPSTTARARLLGRLTGHPRLAVAAALSLVAYVVGNALLFRLGGHPFDMGDEELYAYVARVYGADHLFYLPNVSSLASIWHGTPYLESGFPYQAVFAYLFTGIGWLASALFGGGGTFRLDSAQLENLIKSVNVLFGLLDSALIYLILRRLRLGLGWSVAGAAFFMFNPAVWFSMSVWGQTHVVSIFFLLLVFLMIETGRPTVAWLALAAACLTRPQMLVFGLVLGVVLLRRFGWRDNLPAVSFATVITFLALLPLTVATSPSLPVDIVLNNFHVQEAGGNDPSLTTVSQDAYSVWPLVTYFVQGASGLQRAFVPSSDLLIGSLTYQRASQILTGLALVVIVGWVATRRRERLAEGSYLPLVALAIVSFLMLLTGTLATHFLLALPVLLLCRRWLGSVAYVYVVVIWTITTLVPMYGDMGVVISASDHPLLAASRNAVTNFVVNLYAWDRFITVGVVANVCAMVWLAVLAFQGSERPRETQLART